MKAIIFGAALALGLSFSAQAADDCAPSNGYGFICGIKASEDLVVLPKTNLLITSAMEAGGGLNLVDTRTKKVTNLYPGTGAVARPDKAKFAGCPSPLDPKLVVLHGLSLRPAAGGHYTLYATNHGGRESIEAFDVDMAGGTPKVSWIGCVLMPANDMPANSVAAFKDGTLIATVLMLPGKTGADMRAGRSTGAVYQWTPGTDGFKLLAGTELSANNGIETSPNDDEFYVVALGARKIVTFSRKDPSKPLREAQLVGVTPDNVRFADDGKLVTAGQADPDASCTAAPGTPEYQKCPRGFLAVSVDPKTMAVTEIARGPGTPAFSGATMAVQVGKELWIGTFNADKLAYWTLK
jgi:hypothetical protein